MNTKYIILTAAFIFSINAPTQAQSDEGGFLEGIQSSLSNMFDNTIQGTEAGRLFMLFTNDISLTMKAHYEKELFLKNFRGAPNERNRRPIILLIGILETPSDASMYAEFDWDNKALSMHFKETENKNTTSFAMEGLGGSYEKTNKAIDHYQYTDKDGYWYVPYEVPPYRTRYIKFNAKQAVQDGLELLEVNEIISVLRDITSVISFELFPDNNYLRGYLNGITWLIQNESIANTESLENGISQILNEDLLSIVGFPVFIHWALLYSPDYIKARYNVTEEIITINIDDNLPDVVYTILTVASGEERGKYMMFDQYNRLVYIDSKEEGSVEFNYDRDLTVNLPPAFSYSDIIGQAMERRN